MCRAIYALIIAVGLSLASIAFSPLPAATTTTAAVTMKLCPDGSTVGYRDKCPTPGTVKKICPDGAIVAYSAACSSTPATTGSAAQPTRKLCLPSGTVVGYTAACPAGTASTQKICPFGQQVAYSTSCPKTATVLDYGSKVRATRACQSTTNTNDMLTTGATYTIVGFAHWQPIGTVSTNNGAHDIAILNDATHLGDGWFGIFVPVDCVTGA